MVMRWARENVAEIRGQGQTLTIRIKIYFWHQDKKEETGFVYKFKAKYGNGSSCLLLER